MSSNRKLSMSFKSVAAKNAVLRIVGVMTVAAAALVSFCPETHPEGVKECSQGLSAAKPLVET